MRLKCYLEDLLGREVDLVIKEAVKPRLNVIPMKSGFAVVLRKFQIPENLESLELNERQKKAIEYLKIHKNITRKIYIEINNISPRQVNKDLNDLLEKRLIRKQGRGRAISYILK